MSRKSRRRKQAARNEIVFQVQEKAPTRALVIHPDMSALSVPGDGGAEAGQNVASPAGSTDSAPAMARLRDPERQLEEAVSLARAIDLDVHEALIVPVRRLVPATLLGGGKVEELGARIDAAQAELVIVNTRLSPVQQRNLEKAWQVKVLDRTGLILEIFGRRASTKEGRLQVELAHLEYQRTRLVRSWTHLERQRGGAGFMGGPGETQIEIDRRILKDRIARIRRQLQEVVRTRELHRKTRRKTPWPVVALAGYTNTGKSTLFNRLTRAQVLAKDQLFATLDPTMRRIRLPAGREVVLSDTVGFISDLPTTLVAAFRATLEEVVEADLILHVRDMRDVEEARAQKRDVLQVLAELGIGADRPVIEVWNKADLWDAQTRERLRRLAARRDDVVITSAVTGEGLDELQRLMAGKLATQSALRQLRLSHAEGADLAWCYRHAEVLAREDMEDGVSLTLRLAPAELSRARKRFGARLMEPAENGVRSAVRQQAAE